MNKNLYALAITAGLVVVILGFLDVRLGGWEVCAKPYILVEGSCCLDADENLACDKYQTFDEGWNKLNATIGYDNGNFVVRNNGPGSWDNCMAEADNQWVYSCGHINPGIAFSFGRSDVHGIHGEVMQQGYSASNLTIYAIQGVAFKSFV
jgi:hypothetical protein